MASAAVRLPGVLPADASHPRKRFTAKQAEAPGPSSIASGSGSSATSSAPRRPQIAGAVPDSVLDDPEINAAIAALLPSNYKLEVHKTIHHIRTYGVICVALQMPEGLTMWATALTDIIERFTDATTVIMGDVTYGACCVDDYTARALGCDMLVHYGHSCLVPVDQTLIRTLYVFVEISIDVTHLSASIRSNFPSSREHFRRKILKIGGEKEAVNSSSSTASTAARIQVGVEGDAGNGTVSEAMDSLALSEESTHLAIVGTVQFINAIHGLKDALEEEQQLPDRPGQSDEVSHQTRLMITSGEGMSDEAGPAAASTSSAPSIPSWASGRYRVTVPQIRPLSPGEILGCTSPSLADRDGRLPDAILYLGDGRFHLESAMIANPRVPAFRYDPYEKRLVRERYDHARMRGERAEAVDEARRGLLTARDSNVGDAGDETGERPASSAWGIVLGTLGRQGSRKVLSHLSSTLQQPTDLRTSSSLVMTSQPAPPRPIPHVPILLSELSPQKLRLFGPHLAAFVQTSCPRLSIDWGAAFDRPLLSPYEAAVAIGRTKGWDTDVAGLGVVHEEERRRRARVRKLEGNVTGERAAPAAPSIINEEDERQYDYPMDFYADDSRGPWTPRHGMQPVRRKGGISNVALLMRSRKANAEAAAGQGAGAGAGKVQTEDKAQTQQAAPSMTPTPPA